MKRLLTLFAFALIAIGAQTSGAFAASADLNGVTADDGEAGVYTVGPSGQAKTALPDECKQGGTFYETLNANTALGYYKANVRAETPFADAIPKPASAYNCLSSIFSIFQTLSSFTWPPNLGALFSGFIDQIINKACTALWNAIAGSSLVKNYNKVAGTYNSVSNCTGDLASCRPIAQKKADIMGSINFGF